MKFRKTCPCCRFKMKNDNEIVFVCTRCEIAWVDSVLQYADKVENIYLPVPEGLLLPVRERAL